MKKVIKPFKNLTKSDQTELYMNYSEGQLERTVFPFNGGLEEGVIFKTEVCVYLVPISSIIDRKSARAKDFEEYEMSDYDIDEEI